MEVSNDTAAAIPPTARSCFQSTSAGVNPATLITATTDCANVRTARSTEADQNAPVARTLILPPGAANMPDMYGDNGGY
jgi:hypothetical protein